MCMLSKEKFTLESMLGMVNKWKTDKSHGGGYL